MKTILVTGGLGFIGSHVCVELMKADYDVIVVDNLSNSDLKTIGAIQRLASTDISFYKCDVRDYAKMCEVFDRTQPDAVIHLAGLKSVRESVERPWIYYENNVIASAILLSVMRLYEVNDFIFSSTATVYDTSSPSPLSESSPLAPTTPYARSKLMVEDMIRDSANADPDFRYAILRYFNPIGAHPSGSIGEMPVGIPNNLMPFICGATIGSLPSLRVFGNDHPTRDGTCIRDYLHVCDLAEGHVLAVEALEKHSEITVNFGTGKGVSVLELIGEFQAANNVTVPYEIAGRREGDAPSFFAGANKARSELGWFPKRTLGEMCKDSWRWQQNSFNK